MYSQHITDWQLEGTPRYFVSRFKYNASMLDCDEIPESSETGKKKYLDLF
jgi:hypothetical protein